MKKLLFLLMSMAVAVSASAGITKINAQPVNDHHKNMQLLKTEAKADFKAKKIAPVMNMMKAAVAAPTRGANDVISVQPEGDMKTYTRSGEAIVRTSSGVSLTLQSSTNTVNIVYADDNVIYMQNPVYGINNGNWVRGTINGDKITIPLGQFISWNSSYNYGMILAWGDVIYDGSSVSFERDENVTEVTYTVNDNVITLDNSVGDAYNFDGATGLTVIWDDDLTWNYYTEWNTVLTGSDVPAPTYELITSQPEGELVEYYRSGDALVVSGSSVSKGPQSGKAYIVYAEGNTVYLKDPIYGAANGTWVKGEINSDGTKITVPMDQPIAYNSSYNAYIVLRWGSTDFFEEDGETYLGFMVDNTVTEITYTIDGNIISLDNSSGDVTLSGDAGFVGTGLSAIWTDDNSWYGNMDWKTVYTLAEPLAPAVPANPEALEWYDAEDESGNSYFVFNINMVDVDGNPMDAENVTYSIYTDEDQLFTFPYADYSYGNDDIFVDGMDLTEIPYGVDGYDFYSDYIFFYRTNAEGFDPMFTWRIGIQVHNTVDGVKNSSDIIYLEVFEKPEPDVMIGDVNDDKNITIADVTALINYLLNGGEINMANSDVNGDQGISIGDVTALINMLLNSGK